MQFTLRRWLLCLAIFSLAVGISAAAPTPTVRPGVVARLNPTLNYQALSLVDRANMFRSALSAHLQGAKLNAATERFKLLPDDLQQAVLALADDKYRLGVSRPDYNLARVDLSKIRFQLYRITDFVPEQGQVGEWAFAIGNGFNANCQVRIEGTPVETNFLDWSNEFFPNSLAFRVPATQPRGVDRAVTVHNNATNKSTAAVMYHLIAPRGYRGYYGWQFGNFSDATIPWEALRHYYGQSAVEYPDGTHRPSVQTWYNSSYKGMGGGGNCFGMSVSSLRERNDNRWTLWETWFGANPQYYPWPYAWRTETKQTVQEAQGGWATQEFLETYVNITATQDHKACFNRVASLVGNWVNRPILVFWWAGGGGHAVVPYKTEVAGDDHRMILYDNNNPYRENETGSIDPSVGHVYWGANSFAYAGANEAYCVSYNECTPATRHLPGSEFGGPGSSTVLAVLDPGTHASQITDQAGRTFFNPDGTINENPNTKIPLSLKLGPMLQQPPILRPGPVLRPGLPLLLQGPPIPPDWPEIYVFNNARGKSLTFNLAAGANQRFRFFSNGFVASIEGAGPGLIRLNNLLNTRDLEILNPNVFLLSRAQIIRSRPVGDRVFDLTNFQNLGPAAVRLVPAGDGSSLEVRGPTGLQFDLGVQGPVGLGMQGAGFAGLQLATNSRAILIPQNWGNLLQSGLRLELRNLQTNALQTRILPRISAGAIIGDSGGM